MTERAHSFKATQHARIHIRLSERQAAFIAHLVDELPEGTAITWNTIVQLAERHFKVSWTRQTLEKRPAIKEAYLRRNNSRVAASVVRNRRRDIDPEVERRLGNLRAENDKLRTVLREYDCRLVRYVANAIAHGLTEAQLDAPLRPVIQSGQHSKLKK